MTFQLIAYSSNFDSFLVFWSTLHVHIFSMGIRSGLCADQSITNLIILSLILNNYGSTFQIVIMHWNPYNWLHHSWYIIKRFISPIIFYNGFILCQGKEPQTKTFFLHRVSKFFVVYLGIQTFIRRVMNVYFIISSCSIEHGQEQSRQNFGG